MSVLDEIREILLPEGSTPRGQLTINTAGIYTVTAQAKKSCGVYHNDVPLATSLIEEDEITQVMCQHSFSAGDTLRVEGDDSSITVWYLREG